MDLKERVFRYPKSNVLLVTTATDEALEQLVWQLEHRKLIEKYFSTEAAGKGRFLIIAQTPLYIDEDGHVECRYSLEVISLAPPRDTAAAGYTEYSAESMQFKDIGELVTFMHKVESLLSVLLTPGHNNVCFSHDNRNGGMLFEYMRDIEKVQVYDRPKKDWELVQVEQYGDVKGDSDLPW